MVSIYLAKSNAADYDLVSSVRNFLQGRREVEVKEHKGGNYTHTELKTCDILIVVPPVNTYTEGTRTIPIGRGLYEQLIGVPNIPRLIVKPNGRNSNRAPSFYRVNDVHEIANPKNWSDSYALVTHGLSTIDPTEVIESFKYLSNKERDLIKDLDSFSSHIADFYGNRVTDFSFSDTLKVTLPVAGVRTIKDWLDMYSVTGISTKIEEPVYNKEEHSNNLLLLVK